MSVNLYGQPLQALTKQLAIPVIAAPMFLVSTRESVIAACRGGIIGSCPALNVRDSEELESFLGEVEEGISTGPYEGVAACGPHSLNLVVHRSNPRLKDDLAVIVKKKVPIIMTSLGADADVIKQIHDYGGLVFHDVISVRHAERALEAGVDGIIAVTQGAGGHAGTLHPFPFIHQLRAMTDKPIILAGAV